MDLYTITRKAIDELTEAEKDFLKENENRLDIEDKQKFQDILGDMGDPKEEDEEEPDEDD